MAGLCTGCFYSHFPKPNMKDCKMKRKNTRDKLFFPIRLRGGADSAEAEGRDLIRLRERAIHNANFHGISLHLGVENLANGNCAFETVLDSIHTRDCFGDKFDGTPDYWRHVWMSEVERIAYKDWSGNLSESEWHEGWSELKKPRVYEHQLGDFVLPGIAHCVKKDILIFNTSSSAHDPVYVVESSKLCNQQADTDVPICLGYDQSL